MTAGFAFEVGVAACEVFKAEFGKRPRVLVGMDTRLSGKMLAHGVSAGLTSRGAHVVWLDILPTPGVAHLCQHLEADAGVVISASHNPFEDNGIKFFSGRGEKISDAFESQIEAQLATLETLPAVTGSDIGVSEHYDEAGETYLKFLLSHAPYLDGLRVGLDCANGASFEIAPKLFKQIGARLDVINFKPDGSNINANCGSTHPETIQARVMAHSLEVGITFDGDADRALLVDKKGRLVTGDHMLAICAVSRHEKVIVATIMSNLGLERYLAERDIKLLRTKVGDRHVFEALQREQLTLGGEQSGHLLFLDRATTGDGLLSALQVLAAVRKSGKPLEKWMDEIPMYPQTLVNVPVASERKDTIADDDAVRQAIREAEAKLQGDGRINVRPSGTEPLVRVMVEGPKEALIHDVAGSIVAVIEKVGGAELPQA